MATLLIHLCFLGLMLFQDTSAQKDDLPCLLKFEASVGDPKGHLQTWTNTTLNPRSICTWYGVTCYGNMAPPVYFIKLSRSCLNGSFPQGLKGCNALTHLDLSDNSFTGPIPSKLCSDLPNLVDLDLSHNKIQGSIPPSLAECEFMNNLLLNNNKLSGPIPEQIGYLNRLQRFDVSSNQLEGLIPQGAPCVPLQVLRRPPRGTSVFSMLGAPASPKGTLKTLKN